MLGCGCRLGPWLENDNEGGTEQRASGVWEEADDEPCSLTPTLAADGVDPEPEPDDEAKSQLAFSSTEIGLEGRGRGEMAFAAGFRRTKLEEKLSPKDKPE